MAFKKGDKLYFGRGPVEFIGIVENADEAQVLVNGVETGYELEKCESVSISMNIQEPHSLYAMDDAEWVQRTKHEPAFGGTKPSSWHKPSGMSCG